MGYYLLIGAGFSRNWDGPLSEEITGSLLGDLHDDVGFAKALRSGPFEDAFQGFQQPAASDPAGARLRRFQDAVSGLFTRLNKTFSTKTFEFSPEIEFSVMHFLAKFGAIFSLNQDLLLEIHYVDRFSLGGKWSGIALPGMTRVPPENQPAHSMPPALGSRMPARVTARGFSPFISFTVQATGTPNPASDYSSWATQRRVRSIDFRFCAVIMISLQTG